MWQSNDLAVAQAMPLVTNQQWECYCREACTPEEGGCSAKACIHNRELQDGDHHTHSLRYYQGGSTTVVSGQPCWCCSTSLLELHAKHVVAEWHLSITEGAFRVIHIHWQ